MSEPSSPDPGDTELVDVVTSPEVPDVFVTFVPAAVDDVLELLAPGLLELQAARPSPATTINAPSATLRPRINRLASDGSGIELIWKTSGIGG
jgi:hypothetical protein